MPASDTMHGALSHATLAGMGKDFSFNESRILQSRYAVKSMMSVDFNIASAGIWFSGSCFFAKFI